MYTLCQHCGELTPQRVPLISGNSRPQSLPAGTVVSRPDGNDVMIETLELRIKDKHAVWLRGLTLEYDLQKLVSGSTKGEDALSIPSKTLQQLCEEYATLVEAVETEVAP